MSETTLLESRVDKIERDNRRLKLTVGALLLVMAAVPLIGAVMPQEIPELIQAREFQVIGEFGNERAGMSASGIAYNDEKGTIRAGMSDGGIGYFDENGTIRAGMSDGGIGYFDENGNPRVAMGGPGIHYQDENRNTVWSTECAPNC